MHWSCLSWGVHVCFGIVGGGKGSNSSVQTMGPPVLGFHGGNTKHQFSCVLEASMEGSPEPALCLSLCLGRELQWGVGVSPEPGEREGPAVGLLYL